MSRIYSGMLVTDTMAPEDNPPWAGVVLGRDGGWGDCWWVRRLGSTGCYTTVGARLRPLSAIEAVALAEMLAGGRWEPHGRYGAVGLGVDADTGLHAVATPEGLWVVNTNADAGDRRASGNVRGGVSVAKVAASRALVAYTCGWRGKA